MTLKLLLLQFVQTRSFRQADGIIFLTRYARDVVMPKVRKTLGKLTIIPHGIDERFVCLPREQLDIMQYSQGRPFRVLYVSDINMYKHQWHVAHAIAQLRTYKLPVVLELVGSAYPPALARLKKALHQIDPSGEFVRYLGAVPYAELHVRYAEADLCLFASSCENMPNILLEKMASGLTIACSNRGPMPEILGNSAAYFNPERSDEIVSALQYLIENQQIRSKFAAEANEKAKTYSWKKCADETFSFISKTVLGEMNAHISSHEGRMSG